MGDPDEDMDDIKSAIKQLQAEMLWVRSILTMQRPSDAPLRTSPPWLTLCLGGLVPIVVAVIATKPWG
jgi:hypothetical protein